MQHLGLLSIIIYWSYILSVVAYDRRGLSTPICDHVLNGKRRLVYLIIAPVSFSLFYAFCIFWLLPTYSLGFYAYILITMAYLAQLTTTFVAHTDTNRNQAIHDLSARISGTAAFLLLPIIALSGFIAGTERYVLLGVYGVLTIIGGYLMRGNQPYTLPVQLFIFTSFYAVIMYLTYSF
jgi:hypothetical protein